MCGLGDASPDMLDPRPHRARKRLDPGGLIGSSVVLLPDVVSEVVKLEARAVVEIDQVPVAFAHRRERLDARALDAPEVWLVPEQGAAGFEAGRAAQEW